MLYFLDDKVLQGFAHGLCTSSGTINQLFSEPNSNFHARSVFAIEIDRNAFGYPKDGMR